MQQAKKYKSLEDSVRIKFLEEAEKEEEKNLDKKMLKILEKSRKDSLLNDLDIPRHVRNESLDSGNTNSNTNTFPTDSELEEVD